MDVSDRLRWSIRNNKLPMVQRLVRRFPDLLENIDPTNGWSSLHYASYDGHYAICVFLVQQGHDKDEISLAHDRSTPLHIASSQNHEQTVHFLAQHIPRCLDWVNVDHETALMVAARKGHDPCINLLLDFGADIDLGNRDKNRPIHIAAAYGHLKTLRTLVDRGADVQTPNSEGWRPVQYCSTYQVQDYLQSLIHEKSESSKRKLAPPTVTISSGISSASSTTLPFPVRVDTSTPSSIVSSKISPTSNVPSSLPRQYVAFQSRTSPKRTAIGREPSIGSITTANTSTTTIMVPKFNNYYNTNGSTAKSTSNTPTITNAPTPTPPSATEPSYPRRKPPPNLSGTLQLDKPLPIFSSTDPYSPSGSSSSNPNSPIGPGPGPIPFALPPPRKSSTMPGNIESSQNSSSITLGSPVVPYSTPQTPTLPIPNFTPSRNSSPTSQNASPQNIPSQSTRLSSRSRLLDISVSTVHKH